MTTGKILGNTYTINGQAVDASEYRADPTADVYYEVIRLMEGRILFLDDHLERFRRSISVSDLDYPGDKVITENLRLLLNSNGLKGGNIRICLQRSPGQETGLLCYFVPYIYPEQCMYLSGVQVFSYPHVRPNPGIKKWDNSFRVSVQQFIRDHGIYEAILVNRQGEVTEGSRSNIFFIDTSGRLVSPPEKDVLPGITRKYVLQICGEMDIPVVENPVALSELGDMVSCFISGTSPKVLPVWQLDAYQFQVDHPVLKLIMERFETLLKDDLKQIV